MSIYLNIVNLFYKNEQTQALTKNSHQEIPLPNELWVKISALFKRDKDLFRLRVVNKNLYAIATEELSRRALAKIPEHPLKTIALQALNLPLLKQGIGGKPFAVRISAVREKVILALSCIYHSELGDRIDFRMKFIDKSRSKIIIYITQASKIGADEFKNKSHFEISLDENKINDLSDYLFKLTQGKQHFLLIPSIEGNGNFEFHDQKKISLKQITSL